MCKPQIQSTWLSWVSKQPHLLMLTNRRPVPVADSLYNNVTQWPSENKEAADLTRSFLLHHWEWLKSLWVNLDVTISALSMKCFCFIYYYTVPPKVKVNPSTQFHTTGSSVRLQCHADGVPEPSIQWEMNEMPLEGDAQHYMLLGKSPGHSGHQYPIPQATEDPTGIDEYSHGIDWPSQEFASLYWLKAVAGCVLVDSDILPMACLDYILLIIPKGGKNLPGKLSQWSAYPPLDKKDRFWALWAPCPVTWRRRYWPRPQHFLAVENICHDASITSPGLAIVGDHMGRKGESTPQGN